MVPRAMGEFTTLAEYRTINDIFRNGKYMSSALQSRIGVLTGAKISHIPYCINEKQNVEQLPEYIYG